MAHIKMRNLISIRRLLSLKKVIKNASVFSHSSGKGRTFRIVSIKEDWAKSNLIRAFHIADLEKDRASETPFCLDGWVVGKGIKFSSIEIISNGFHLLTVSIDKICPDVAKRFGLSHDNVRIGFRTYINPFALPQNFELQGVAVTEQGDKVRVFTMRGERRPIEAVGEHMISPLLITTLGRSGSSYVLGLLASHPKITVYRPFQVEARYALYWTQMFLSLTHPKSWIYPVNPFDLHDAAWILGKDTSRPSHNALYPDMLGWFNGPYVDNLFAFCTQNLQKHYMRIAQIQGKNGPRYFCEKSPPNALTQAALCLLPGAREIILVRDFRDVLCSIMAFNKKRGFLAFGRDQFDSDEEYVSGWLLGAAHSLLTCWENRKDDSLLLRYEDLIARPELTLTRVFEHLEIEASSRRVNQVLKAASKIQPKTQREHKTTASPRDSLERFRKELDPKLLALSNSLLREPLEAFGYPV